nr:hypothetical protein [Tanacetum cinerariifolium]
MVNTRTDAELSAAVQNALQTLLPQIRAEIREEFRTSSRPSDSGGNPPLVTIHTWRERFNKQKPRSFEKATASTLCLLKYALMKRHDYDITVFFTKRGVTLSTKDSLVWLIIPCHSGPDILDGEVSGALIEIHKADGKNDSSNVNRNAVNKGLSYSANDPMVQLTCSSPDIDNGEVVVAGLGIHKADGHNDIPHANHNAVNQVICGSANDSMAYGNNDYTYSQRDPSTLDVLVQGFNSQKNQPGIDVLQHVIYVDYSVVKLNDHPIMDSGVKSVPVDNFMDDFMDVLNDEESIPNYSLDDMKLQDEEEKLITTPAHVNHQPIDELIDVHEDKTTVLQENVKYVNMVTADYKPCLGRVFANVKAKRKKCGIKRNYVLRFVKERKKRLAMALDSSFGQQATTTLAPPKIISRSVNGDYIASPEFLEVRSCPNDAKARKIELKLGISSEEEKGKDL